MEPIPNEPADPAVAPGDAFRVQVAAVAAQQAALALEEDRLRQRAAALERHEAQLAAHFDERQRRVADLQEQLRRDREALKAERAAAAAELDAARQALERERAEVVAAGDDARTERLRLVELRKRLLRRWRQHWRAREAELSRSGRELAAWRKDVEGQATALNRDRAALLQDRMRFNGENEVARRKLQHAWDELALTQQRWDECLNVEHGERERRAADLATREEAVAAGERALAEREQLWKRTESLLALEVEGLESRVSNLRTKLAAESPPVADVAAPADGAGQPPSRFRGPAVPEAVTRLVDELSDQRAHLLEQWDCLLSVQGRWQTERAALLGDLEGAAARLDQRERQLRAREGEAAAAAVAAQCRQESVERSRAALEGWRARLGAREAAFEGERATLLSEVRIREASVTAEALRLENLRERWKAHRRQEVEELKAVRARCEDARATYLALWHECQSQRAALAQEQRDLASRALALERLRLELPGRAPDAAAAERRLAKLEHRIRARVQGEERELAAAQRAAQAEVARLAAGWRRLREEEAGLLARQEELDRTLEAREKARAEEEAEGVRRREEVSRLKGCHERDARELAALREEVERVARTLIDDAGEAAAPVGRQAA